MRDKSLVLAILAVAIAAGLILAFPLLSTAAVASPDCIHNSPLVDISPSTLETTPGKIVTFSVDVKNKDTDNCPLQEFTLEATVEGGLSASFKPSKLFISPNDVETALLEIRVPSDAAAKDLQVRVVAKANNLIGSDSSILRIREDFATCRVHVNNLRFKETNADRFETEFSRDDEVKVVTDISLSGNSASGIFVELFVNGALFDSKSENLNADSEETIDFSRKILTKNFADDIRVKVVATPSCNPSEDDSETRTLFIKLGEEDIDIDFRVGTPSNSVVGQQITARVFIENNGEEDVDVNADVFLCKVGGECVEMQCKDSIILVEEDDTEEIACMITPTESGSYFIKAIVTFEGDEDTEFSRTFSVSDVLATTNAGQVGETLIGTTSSKLSFVCSGNVRQAVQQTSSGMLVTDVEYCPFGCFDGKCNLVSVESFQPSQITRPAGSATPSTIVQKTEEPVSSPIFNRPQLEQNMFYTDLLATVSLIFLVGILVSFILNRKIYKNILRKITVAAESIKSIKRSQARKSYLE